MSDNNSFNIMIIDDNQSIHHDFIKILKTDSFEELDKLGGELFGESSIESDLPHFKIETASQGQEGVAQIEKALKQGVHYSLVFVDVRMPPGWDGIETIKHIWALDKEIQVVICTAYSDYSWEETIGHLGKTDNLLILKKPFDNISVKQLACALTTKWKLAADSRQYTSTLQQKIADKTLSLQNSLLQLEQQATHDPLTGLANRVKLHNEMLLAIENADKSHHPFAVIFIDLDRFKLINDSLSHQAGDEMLQNAAERLNSLMLPGNTLARLGGDEFVMIYQNIMKDDEIETIVHQINKIFHEDFSIYGKNVVMTTSIGISFYPENGKTVDDLLRNADAAMYRVKARKGNSFEFYSPEMDMMSLEQLNKETELRQALNRNEFYLCYQPQIDLTHERLVAVEALIRWNHPQKGVLLPIDFIPLVEDTGLIVPLGEWIIRAACEQNKTWQDAGLPPIRIAINVAQQQFEQENFIEVVKKILQETGLKAEYLEMEITENVLTNSNIINTIVQLKNMGVMVTIDDFGMGYSNLSALRQLPLDRLKIDSSLIKQLPSSTNDEIIIRAVIEMAKQLKLEVLAEGVETIEQLNFLKKHNFSEVQGFYCSHPLDSKDVKKYLSNPKKLKAIIGK
jgi:diguanylate cyclase (GGDEF)-like protein